MPESEHNFRLVAYSEVTSGRRVLSGLPLIRPTCRFFDGWRAEHTCG
jgi:hypothetical protein